MRTQQWLACVSNRSRRAHGPGWALVGDAGYHRDPVTGHGLSDAYPDAELLAVAPHRTLRGDTDDGTAAQKPREIVEHARARCAVDEVLTGQVPVTIEVDSD
jgi:flavin-dependent dehydrogenase